MAAYQGALDSSSERGGKESGRVAARGAPGSGGDSDSGADGPAWHPRGKRKTSDQGREAGYQSTSDREGGAAEGSKRREGGSRGGGVGFR